MTDLNQTDAERFALLDRIAERIPELDLKQRTVEWTEMPDGAPGLVFATAGADLPAVGPTSPLIEGSIGCVVIRPDGSRYLARVMPDPLAQQQPE